MFEKYNLVRRKKSPNEENLIVGDRVTKTTVRVYKYVEDRKGYVYLATVKDDDLKYTGMFVQGKAWNVPALLEKVA